MKRLFVLAQWLVVVFLLTSLVMFLLKKDTPPEHRPGSWKAWNGFYALAVEGVLETDDPRYLSPSKLNTFLAALREAGYRAVTPQDIENFYYFDKPLPDKAVLLMFEGGRKDHIVRATPQLVKNRFIGTLFVPTSVTDRWGNHFVNRANLRRIARSPHWRLASMGHEAIDTVRISEEDERGHFLSSRIWSRRSRESDAAFHERVFRDYERAAAILEKAAGRPAVAYLYPYGDAGAHRNADPVAESVNQAVVRQHHKIAFTREGQPFNEYAGNPYALSRLRLRGDWTADDLIARLEAWRPDIRPVDGFGERDRWELVGADIDAEGLTLGDGASAMVRGSDGWRNLELRAQFEVPAGAMGVLYVRYGGAHSYVRMTFEAGGVRVQEKRAGRLQTLSWLLLTGTGDSSHNVLLRIRDNRIWVEHNGVAFARSIPVSRLTRAGAVWMQAEKGTVACGDFHARPIQPLFVVGSAYDNLGTGLTGKATALLPFWFRVGEEPQLNEREQLSVMLAAQTGLVTIPVVEVDRRLDTAEARDVVERIQQHLNTLTIRMLVRDLGVTGYQPELFRVCRKLGFGLSYIVDAADAEELLNQGVELGRNERLIVTGDPAAVTRIGETMGAAYPPGRLVLEMPSGSELPPGAERAIVPNEQ